MSGFRDAVYNSPVMAPYRMFRRKHARQDEERFQEHNLGFRFSGSPFNFNPEWEVEERSTFSRLMPQCDVFLDIGSNQGIYTCLAASLGCHVIAFEPLPQNLRFLLRNIEANGYKAEVFAMALASECGVLPIFGERDIASLEKGWTDKVSNVQTLVPVNSLDAVIGERLANRKVLVKLDVEGAELAVLSGSRRLLSSRIKPKWIIETVPSVFSGSFKNEKFLDLFVLMDSHGYTCKSLDGKNSISLEEVKSWQSVLPPKYARGNFLFEAI